MVVIINNAFKTLQTEANSLYRRVSFWISLSCSEKQKTATTVTHGGFFRQTIRRFLVEPEEQKATAGSMCGRSSVRWEEPNEARAPTKDSKAQMSQWVNRAVIG